jgi:hypothetical protein
MHPSALNSFAWHADHFQYGDRQEVGNGADSKDGFLTVAVLT